MNDVTQLLSAIEQGDRQAASQLLPLVYDELRRLAARRLAQEAPGQSLQPTALVHEAYLRLVTPANSPAPKGEEGEAGWNGRGHFFAAAAEAMRRILVDHARARKAKKRQGTRRRVELRDQAVVDDRRDDDLLALNDALAELERHDPQAANLVKLRYFSGLSHREAAESLGITRRVADRVWAVAKAWLYQRLHPG